VYFLFSGRNKLQVFQYETLKKDKYVLDDELCYIIFASRFSFWIWGMWQ